MVDHTFHGRDGEESEDLFDVANRYLDGEMSPEQVVVYEYMIRKDGRVREAWIEATAQRSLISMGFTALDEAGQPPRSAPHLRRAASAHPVSGPSGPVGKVPKKMLVAAAAVVFLGAVGLMSSPLWRDVPPAPATVPVPVPGAPEFAARDLPLSDPQFKELLQILNLRARGAEESPVEEALALIGREDPDWIDRFIERDDVRAHIALLGLPDGHHPGPRHAGLLLAVLREQYYPPRKRFRAIAHLRRTFNDRSVALVLRIALDAKDEPIFKAAVQTIARFSKEKVPSTVPDTLATLAMARNFKAAVPDALDLLARTETQSLQTWAHDILDGKHDTQVPDGYYTAARYIGSLEASLFPVLERLAKDGGDEKGRAYALERLAVVQPTSAWPAELRKLASAEKDWKRILLAAHLQQHATSDDLPLLRSLAIDDHPKVQFLARSTLQRLKTSPDGDDEDQTRPDNRLPGHH